jgi:hypothetical protein
MTSLTALFPFLVGLFFIVLGVFFLVRARAARATRITARTRRRLGLIYLCAGITLTLWGSIRL